MSKPLYPDRVHRQSDRDVAHVIEQVAAFGRKRKRVKWNTPEALAHLAHFQLNKNTLKGDKRV